MRPNSLALSLTLCLGTAAHGGQAEFVGAFEWERPESYFGGWSGLEIGADGEEFLAIGDRSQVVEGRLLRENGVIVGVEAGTIGGLQATNGVEIHSLKSPTLGDSEGLAAAPGGGFFVSFEDEDRVWRYDGPSSAAEPLPFEPNFRRFSRNSGLEALALAPDDVLFAIPEVSDGADIPFPVFRYRDGVWDSTLSLPRRGNFRISGADFDPDGRLYILERIVTPIGFRSRVRRFGFDEGRIVREEVLMASAPGEHDNLEGIAVWSAPDGLRITLISDNNFRWFQVTEFVEYRLTD
ncbi:MAG: esterase-like activity of phytase family protein [Pseudomonadota bacterium]